MRKLVLLACATVLSGTMAMTAGAAEPDVGTLSVERGRGVVLLDIRGVVLGRLGSGVLRVTDLTPRDRFEETVVGKRVLFERVNARTTIYRGQNLRFRMIGGAYRIAVRGTNMSISAVGRGVVVLDAEPRLIGDDVGVYSIDGTDCGEETAVCTPLPDEPERFTLGPEGTDTSGRTRTLDSPTRPRQP